MASMAQSPVTELARDIASFAKDPLGYTRYVWPWGEGQLEKEFGPRKWQTQLMRDLGDHLKDPATRHQPFMAAIASGHGIGKSAEVAFLTGWGLDTCEDCKIVITAETGSQLATKTQPEIDKWNKLSLTGHWKDVRPTSIRMRSEKHASTWRADLITWSEANSEAFAGLHNKGKRIIVIFDEASGIADIIWEVVQGALSDEGTEIIWVAFGNPTKNTGRFRECFGKYAHRWKNYQVDSRKVEGTNKQQIQKDIEDYGEDSDFVRMRWRGEFPRAGSNQLIPSDAVERARKYRAEGYQTLHKVLSADIARFGSDTTAFGWRQGRFSTITDKIRSMDLTQVSRRLMDRIEKEQPDAVVVDGDGMGAGVVDNLRAAGYEVIEFHGGSTADDPRKYYNRRAEVWGKMSDWLIAGAQIDDDPRLADDLIGPMYGFSAQQQIQLEKKEDMKKRGLSSPDFADMLAMTFDVKLSTKRPVNKVVTEYQYPGQSSSGWMRG